MQKVKSSVTHWFFLLFALWIFALLLNKHLAESVTFADSFFTPLTQQ